MNYNADITHCSGYLCPIAHRCHRFQLTLAWNSMEEKPYASFVSSKYDEKVNKCPLFLPIDDNK